MLKFRACEKAANGSAVSLWSAKFILIQILIRYKWYSKFFLHFANIWYIYNNLKIIGVFPTQISIIDKQGKDFVILARSKQVLLIFFLYGYWISWIQATVKLVGLSARKTCIWPWFGKVEKQSDGVYWAAKICWTVQKWKGRNNLQCRCLGWTELVGV